MLTEKTNKSVTDTATIFRGDVTQEAQNGLADQKNSKVLPLERPKGTTGKLQARLKAVEMAQNGSHQPINETPTREETVEIKSRMEAILARMKSRSIEELPDEAAIGVIQNDNGNNPETDEITIAEKSIEELDQRRAAIIAIAREAEVRSREASDKFRQAENKLKEQTELRMQAEERVRQLEDETKQWVAAAQAEELKRIEAEIAKVELEERLKQEEAARVEAEKALKLAEEKAEAAEMARKAAENNSQVIEQIKQEADARIQKAEEAARVAESLIYEADAIARQAEEKCKSAQAGLKREAELRALAEQMLKELAKLGPHLEINWENIEAVLAQATLSAPAVNNGQLTQLQSQIESEQKARMAAEQNRADFESRIQELENKLRKAEDKNKTIENGYKKVIRKQEEELRIMSEQVTRNNEATTSLTDGKPDSDVMFSDIADSSLTNIKTRYLFLGVLLSLLLAGLIWLGYLAYNQS